VIFDIDRLHAYAAKKSRGPAEKRRLARRLLERKRRHASEPAPQKVVAPKTPEEIKNARITRHAKRLRRRVRQRQEMAARSGLPELVRRSLAPHEVARRAAQRAQQAAKATTTEGLPASAGDSRATEAIDSNCVRTVGGKTPLSQDHRNYG
jgi:hypothetical protein